MTVRDIQHCKLAGMQTAKIVETALCALEPADWLRRETEATGGGPRVFYIVNPTLRGVSCADG
ncbi:MAG: hypothetical protein AAGF79_03530 [Pseudomonadota bacterium]